MARQEAWWTVTVLAGLAGCGGPALVESGPVARPSSAAARSSSEIDRLPASSVVDMPDDEPPAAYYQVRAGDTMSQIAREHGTTVERLRDANGLDDANKIAPGQWLYLPP